MICNSSYLAPFYTDSLGVKNPVIYSYDDELKGNIYFCTNYNTNPYKKMLRRKCFECPDQSDFTSALDLLRFLQRSWRHRDQRLYLCLLDMI